jgi:TonB family protein
MRLFKSFIVSILIHAFIFSAGYYMIIWWRNSSFSAINIDLSSSSLMLRPSKTVSRVVQAETGRDWYMNSGRKLAAVPVKVTMTAAADEPAVPACPPPCPDNLADWAAAGSTSRKPVWAEGFITEEDYPQDARAQGLEGVVKVEILIDAAGIVRGVQLIQSSNAKFSNVVLEKLKKAKFDPALDRSGRPIAVHMAIPIVFKLH